jgi:hypothetical protein
MSRADTVILSDTESLLLLVHYVIIPSPVRQQMCAGLYNVHELVR